MSIRQLVPVTALATAIVISSLGITGDGPASAATIVASYAAGHRDVTLNGYGTDGLGMFVLDTGSGRARAWCAEADVAHSRRTDAYGEVGASIDVPELDALVWSLARLPRVDDDTATAAAALVWYYADARRSIGPLVWADGSRGFAPITPLQPEPWDELAALTLDHPVGVRSGTLDLDTVERRVAELHRLATTRRGPWELTATPPPGRFELRGPGGPIEGAVIEVTLHVPDRPDRVVVARTGRDGAAVIDVPTLADGGRIVARVESPGPHREWDGPGDVQRMVTATTTVLTAETRVPPAPRRVEVHKTSADPGISPAGADFELRDASDRIAVRGRTGVDGRLAFPPIDPVRHPGPYTLVETAAPPGLALADPVGLADASTDPATPTVVRVVDQPILTPLVVRKRLSVPEVGPPDRSGFVFSISRRTGGVTHEVTTGVDGRTAPMGLPVGIYDLCEVARPGWAVGLEDTGCRTVEVGSDTNVSDTDDSDPDVSDTVVEVEVESVEVEYVNVVPTPRIDTSAADAADGDQLLGAGGGGVVDRVRIEGLVPGTTYRLVGALSSSAGEPTGATGELLIEATAVRVDVELHLMVPPLPPGDYVIVERLEIAGGDPPLVVAHHDDLDDPDQTLTVLPPPTTTTTTTSSSSTTSSSTTSSSTTSSTTTTTTAVPTSSATSTPAMTSTTSTTSTTRPTTSVPPRGTSTVPTLPRTGTGDGVATALRVGDLVFVGGIALVAVAGLLPRRPRRRA